MEFGEYNLTDNEKEHLRQLEKSLQNCADILGEDAVQHVTDYIEGHLFETRNVHGKLYRVEADIVYFQEAGVASLHRTTLWRMPDDDAEAIRNSIQTQEEPYGTEHLTRLKESLKGLMPEMVSRILFRKIEIEE